MSIKPKWLTVFSALRKSAQDEIVDPAMGQPQQPAQTQQVARPAQPAQSAPAAQPSQSADPMMQWLEQYAAGDWPPFPFDLDNEDVFTEFVQKSEQVFAEDMETRQAALVAAYDVSSDESQIEEGQEFQVGSEPEEFESRARSRARARKRSRARTVCCARRSGSR